MIVECDPRQTFIDNSVEWKRQLTTEQYADREMQLEQVYPKRYWAKMVDGKYAAHCRAIVRPATSGTEASIGNVYTLPEFRGKGYATELLTHVTQVLSKECELVTLFSDIGDYYSRFGYKMYPDVSTLTLDTQKVEWPAAATKLTKTSLTELNALHTEALKVGPGEIAVLPSEQYRRECLREYELTAAAANHPAIDLVGAKAGDEWVSWNFHFQDSKLQVYVMTSFDPVLIQAAHWAAANQGIAKIEIWQSSVLKGKLPDAIDRTSSLPMYISDKEWVQAGKYSWF